MHRQFELCYLKMQWSSSWSSSSSAAAALQLSWTKHAIGCLLSITRQTILERSFHRSIDRLIGNGVIIKPWTTFDSEFINTGRHKFHPRLVGFLPPPMYTPEPDGSAFECIIIIIIHDAPHVVIQSENLYLSSFIAWRSTNWQRRKLTH